MPALFPLEAKLAQTWPPAAWHDVSVLVAVSGGPDSVALLRVLRTLKTEGDGRLRAAHFNHRLRNEESDADEAFVSDICAGIGVPCEVGRAAPGQLAAAAQDGMEAAARQARYQFLQETAARLGARYVLTAHTADDQAETILHRILRGTGIAGLAGMQRVRPLGSAATLVRPLLEVRRGEVLAYLNQIGQAFRSDSTNEDRRFMRNRLRTELLPELAAHYSPSVVDALLRLGRLAGEVQSVVEPIVEDLARRAVIDGPGSQLRVLLDPLRGQPRYVVRELLMAVWRRQGWPLRAMGFDEWDLLADMAAPGSDGSLGAPRKRMFPGGILAELAREQLLLDRPSPARGN
jgi:tRNA(Ile)-lysidine synthase